MREGSGFDDESSNNTLVLQLLVQFQRLSAANLVHVLHLLNLVHMEGRLEQLARESDVFCSFKLVTCQHPNFDPCFLEVSDRFWHVVLKSVLNGGGAQKRKTALESIVDTFQKFFPVDHIILSLFTLVLELHELSLRNYLHCHHECPQSIL